MQAPLNKKTAAYIEAMEILASACSVPGADSERIMSGLEGSERRYAQGMR